MGAVEFFYEHAGWGYNPATETADEGRSRSARLYAEAEAWAKACGITFAWGDDWSIGDHLAEYDGYDHEPETCEACTAFDALGNVVTSVGCVDDADANYRRVIEAELAMDALDRMRAAMLPIVLGAVG